MHIEEGGVLGRNRSEEEQRVEGAELIMDMTTIDTYVCEILK